MSPLAAPNLAMVDDETVVETAASAAEGYILSQYASSAITDLDISVAYTDGTLSMDIYLKTEADEDDEQAVIDAAIVVAEDAVDELFT